MHPGFSRLLFGLRTGFENIQNPGARLHGPPGKPGQLLPFIHDNVHYRYLEQNTLFVRSLIAREIPHFEEEKRNQLDFDVP